ncbi:MAG: ADP-glyceromanno-heptose 6-epimerase [Micavibrio sp.]|nr:MAG: ADP-glyceromanno-heptose 6-epimerase [Micavibrio sp.]
MIIVTGGAGFIGSCLVAGLQEKYPAKRIAVCDRLGSEEKWKNIAGRELYDFILPEDFFSYLKEHAGDIDTVFHLGAVSSTTERDADLIVNSNFILTKKLWHFCAQNGVRLIYASSAATYGDGHHGFRDVETIAELSVLKPLNAYGWSKHVFDRFIARVTQDETLRSREKKPPQHVGLKFFNVYGPNEYHKGEQMSVACKLYPAVAEGGGATLFKSHRPDYGDGGQMRDFVYVKDCVKVMLWFFENPDKNGLFNVGTGKARSFDDLARAIFTAAGREPDITYVDMPKELRAQYQYFTEADMQKIRAAGYMEEFTELEDGIADYVRNYLSKKDGYL